MTLHPDNEELRKTVENCIRHARINTAFSADPEVGEKNVQLNTNTIMQAFQAEIDKARTETALSTVDRLESSINASRNEYDYRDALKRERKYLKSLTAKQEDV